MWWEGKDRHTRPRQTYLEKEDQLAARFGREPESKIPSDLYIESCVLTIGGTSLQRRVHVFQMRRNGVKWIPYRSIYEPHPRKGGVNVQVEGGDTDTEGEARQK